MRMRALFGTLFLLALEGCRSPSPKSGESALSVYSTISFRDVTAQAGITWERENGAAGNYWLPETMGGGGAFLDYDGDGSLDILLVNGDRWSAKGGAGPRPTMALYRGNGKGGFVDVTQQAGLAISLQGMGAAVGDYDNDGRDDLYVTAVGGSRLFRNEDGRRFRDVTRESGVGMSHPGSWPTSAAWLDYDGDGRLDLFVCSYVKWTPETDILCDSKGVKSYCRPQEYPGQTCRLFRNLGNGKFRGVTREAGIWKDDAKALGVCIVDLEDDGRPDIVVANDMEPNFVYHNRGGRFEEIGFTTGISLDEGGKSRAGMGIDSGDYRNDGAHGLAIGNFSYEGVAFYPLSGTQPYAERSRQSGLFGPSYPYVTFGLVFADFDNDALPDLVITNGHIEDSVSKTSPGQTYAQPCVLYRNGDEGAFFDVSQAAGEAVTKPLVGRGLCRGDFDNDGKVDLLLIPNIGPPRLLRNESRVSSHWVTLKLSGTKGNRNGFGAKVIVEANGMKQTAWCRSGSSYLSAHDQRLHFGLGSATVIDRITVRWPSGRMEQFTGSAPSLDLSADREIRLVEGATSPD